MGRQNWKGRKRPNRGQWGDEVFLEALRAVGKQSETEREAARTKAAAAMAVALGRAGRHIAVKGAGRESGRGSASQ